MRYDKRCVFRIVEEIETPLGLEETETFVEKACSEQNISLEEQESVYGKSEIDGVKLHFPQKITQKPETVKYEGQKYSIKKTRHFRRKSVLYLSRSGHDG